MRKFSLSTITLIMVASSAQFLSSCKKNHETPAKPKLSFAESTMTVNEADGTIDVTMKLDKPTNESITITYELDGSAIDKVSAAGVSAYDYEVTSSYLETKIPKGETEGTITLKLYSDFVVDQDEEIEITIKDADTENLEITRDDNIKITVVQEDGLGILLQWGIGEGEHYTDVDMDLFLWAEDDQSNLGLTGIFAANPSHDSPEQIFIPTALAPDGQYGLSCNYYEGSKEPMNFTVTFIKLTDGGDTEDVSAVRSASYTLENLNEWDNSDINPILVETFEKSGGVFSNFGEITVPEAGSRVRMNPTIKGMLKREINAARMPASSILQMLRKK